MTVIKDSNIKDNPFYLGVRARALSSLLSEGHRLIGNYDSTTQLHSFLRHANGNRTEIIVTLTTSSIFVNGILRKNEEIFSPCEAGEKAHTYPLAHVKNPKPKATL